MGSQEHKCQAESVEAQAQAHVLHFDKLNVTCLTSLPIRFETEPHLSSTIQKQQIFWLGNHFDADIRQNFADVLSKAIEQGYTKEMLTETLKQQFSDIGENSQAYWQGLAEHTALRIREFADCRAIKKPKLSITSW